MAANEGPAPPAAPAMSELKKRVFSAIILIPLALVTAFAGGWPFALFWLAAGIAMMWEWTSMTAVAPARPIQIALACALAAFTLLLLLGMETVWFVWLALGAVVVALVLGRTQRDRLWAASGFLYALIIVLVPPIVRAHPNLGLVGLLWMFAVVWATDIAGYFTGRALGGPKLWPRVSPKKTWSGFLGGVVAAAIAGFLVAWLAQRLGWMQPFSLRNTIMLSMVAAVASQLGDLGESALKRHCDVKDSSHLIPGHGGVMDRLDGFWAVSLILGMVLFITWMAG
ncbi:phosphatidate cytidylyltransferase [Microvirga antarctica]|uniref:phosphatidate cytidylyltransferase n=1 Tax=Microvirga antarctica TaxID=2819233 RepID=UPI001B311170|nr:phosphatidate cytidylyltransferase [Microvirga antarctica]